MGKYYWLTGSPVLVVDLRTVLNCNLVHDFSCFVRLLDSLGLIMRGRTGRCVDESSHSLRPSSRCARHARKDYRDLIVCSALFLRAAWRGVRSLANISVANRAVPAIRGRLAQRHFFPRLLKWAC